MIYTIVLIDPDWAGDGSSPAERTHTHHVMAGSLHAAVTSAQQERMDITDGESAGASLDDYVVLFITPHDVPNVVGELDL